MPYRYYAYLDEQQVLNTFGPVDLHRTAEGLGKLIHDIQYNIGSILDTGGKDNLDYYQEVLERVLARIDQFERILSSYSEQR